MHEVGSPSRGERVRDVVCVALLVAGFLALASRLWFVCDDAYITFRYSRHLADGQGLRYNVGDEEPVEGYSNFLWMVLGALVRRIGLDLVVWMPRLSCACGVVLVVWLFVVLRRRFACRPETAALAAASLALFPPFCAWASSGLETMPFALALFATFERLVLRRAGPDALGGAIAGGALLLLRVEGFAWCALLGAAAVVTAWRAGVAWRRPLARYAVVLAVVFGAFLVHRRLHFHRWFSNTTHAKVILDADLAATLRCGVDYVVVFALTYLTPLLFLVAAVRLLARPRLEPAALAIVATSLAFPAFAVVVGGDFMCMGRMLVPAFALQALALGALLRDVASGGAWRKLAAAGLGLASIVVGALPAASLLPYGSHDDVFLVASKSVLERFHFRLNDKEPFTETQMWRVQKNHAERLAAEGRALALCTKPGESSVESAIGAIGYYCELFVYDRFGLVTREVAEAPARKDRKRSPGHDRLTSRVFFLRHQPTYMGHELLRADEFGKIEAVASEWRQGEESDRYAAVLVPLKAEASGARKVMLLEKRVSAHKSADASWREFAQALRQLRGHGHH